MKKKSANSSKQNNKWVKARGKFRVTKDSIRIVTDIDFCKYYARLFYEAHYKTIKYNLPQHGAHITIVNPKIHPNLNLQNYSSLDGTEVVFEYNVEGNYGGFTKGFLNFWFDVRCKKAHKIFKELGLPEQKGFSFAHITILNTKNIQ